MEAKNAHFYQRKSKEAGEKALAMAKEKEAGRKPVFVKKGVSFESKNSNLKK